jgi:hypothetical protein
MRMTIFFLSFLGAFVLLSAEPAEARGRAFCMRGPGVHRNCSFDTMAQCRASASGRLGMHCIANPFPDR